MVQATDCQTNCRKVKQCQCYNISIVLAGKTRPTLFGSRSSESKDSDVKLGPRLEPRDPRSADHQEVEGHPGPCRHGRREICGRAAEPGHV
jgi:hypothetical protein